MKIFICAGEASGDALGAHLLDALAARGKPAVLAVVVEIEECFFHCGKAFIRSKLWQPKAWGEPYKVSFGQMYAARKGGDEQVAAAVDAAIEADYVNNLLGRTPQRDSG